MLPDGRLNRLTIKLVLDHVVEDFKQEEDQLVVVGSGEEKPGLTEGLGQVDQLGRRDH